MKLKSKTVMTVGELRKLIETIPDETPIFSRLPNNGANPGMAFTTCIQRKDAPVALDPQLEMEGYRKHYQGVNIDGHVIFMDLLSTELGSDPLWENVTHTALVVDNLPKIVRR